MGGLLSYNRGLAGEQIAKDYFEFRGYRIIAIREFNHRGKRVGEIDCIAIKDQHIHFIEVKTRQVGRGSFGLASIDYFKRRKLVAAITRYLYRHPEFSNLQLHIDVCVVELYLDNQPKSVTIISDAVADVAGE